LGVGKGVLFRQRVRRHSGTNKGAETLLETVAVSTNKWVETIKILGIFGEGDNFDINLGECRV
jgi:hypothetical protein